MRTSIHLPCVVARGLGIFLIAAALCPAGHARAGGCTPSVGPDVIVGDLTGWSKWGTVGNISAYSFGAVSCNIGDQILPWIANSNQHPVIASNAYRLKNGRFEQIGMSWLKHGWGALTQSLCCTCINPNNFEALGIGCSDPYDSGLNGDQNGFTNGGVLVSGLGPRSQVNGFSGAFPWPYATLGVGGNAIYKRLQIAVADLDPALNAGAKYFAECHYVTPHDAAAGNGYNNASYRRFTVGSFTSGAYTLSFADTTQRMNAAVYAWQANDPLVAISKGDVPGDGRFLLAYRATDNGNGTWHYEYALHNLNSHRGAKSLSLPVPATITVANLEFHDVPYHSGDGFVIGTNYDGADWVGAHGSSPGGHAVSWTMLPASPQDNSNALRWGTMYTMRFDANAPPAYAAATLGLYRAGTPDAITISGLGPRRPGDVDGDGSVDFDDVLGIIEAWGGCPPPSPGSCAVDLDGNGTVNFDDVLFALANWG